MFDAFLVERPEDKNICCGCGAIRGVMPFYMIDERSGRNSFIKENVETFVRQNPQFKISEVRDIEIKTLDDIIVECGIGDGEIADYMSIDIEGMEYEVLSNFDMKKRGPKVLTLEIMKNDVKKCKQMEDYLESVDYTLWCQTGTNYTYIKRKLLV